MSLVLVAIALGIVAGEALTRGRARYFRGGSGVTGTGSLVQLGRWTWPALAFCVAVTIISLALPMSILGYWVARGLAAGEQLPSLWALTRNSLLVSGLAAARGGIGSSAHRLPIRPVPQFLQHSSGEDGVRGICPAGNRHRPGAGILRRQTTSRPSIKRWRF